MALVCWNPKLCLPWLSYWLCDLPNRLSAIGELGHTPLPKDLMLRWHNWMLTFWLTTLLFPKFWCSNSARYCCTVSETEATSAGCSCGTRLRGTERVTLFTCGILAQCCASCTLELTCWSCLR